MKAIQVAEYVQAPLDLQVSDVPDPRPSREQYTIAVHASAANFFDLLQIQGKYQWQPHLPWIGGAEFAGEVVAVPTSPNTHPLRFQIGDRVFGSAQGGYAMKVCALETQLQPIPTGWTYRDAAGLFVTMPTAYASLVVRAGIQKGDCVLVHAAAGGVGLAAVQIAKAFGATVIATAGSPSKLAVARRFGADYGVDYSDEQWPQRVLDLTVQKRGVDIVFDPVGLIEKSTKCIGWNGRLVVVGYAGGVIEKVATNRILLKNIALTGVHWGAYARFEPQQVLHVWEALHRLMDEGKISSTHYTDMEYRGLERVPAALDALGRRETWGKVVIDVLGERIVSSKL